MVSYHPTAGSEHAALRRNASELFFFEICYLYPHKVFSTLHNLPQHNHKTYKAKHHRTLTILTPFLFLLCLSPSLSSLPSLPLSLSLPSLPPPPLLSLSPAPSLLPLPLPLPLSSIFLPLILSFLLFRLLDYKWKTENPKKTKCME
jgi:hypothetical protein